MSEGTELELIKPGALMRHATDVAGVCREIVLKTASTIQGKKFVKVEGWQAIATAHGCCLSIEEVIEDPDGNVVVWSAVRRLSDGLILAKGQGFVGADEKTWKNRDRYARRAMAQTRAMSRVARSVFAHVVVLIDANLQTTPAEEMPEEPSTPPPRNIPTQPTSERGPQGPPAARKPRAPRIEKVVQNPAELDFLIECKKAFVNRANATGMPWAWWKYCVDNAWLLESEPLEDMINNQFINPFEIDLNGTRADNKVRAKAAFDKHQRAIDAMFNAMDDGEITRYETLYEDLSGKGSADPTSAASGPKPASNSGGGPVGSSPGPVAKGCPKCQSTATQSSKDYDDIVQCNACGWQWDQRRKYWEPHPWMEAVCPIPPKGVKRKDYVPVTLGQMMRTDSDRAYGFWMNFHEASGWEDEKGTYHPPSKESVDFAAACKAQFDYAEGEKKSGPESSAASDDGPDF